MATDLQLPENKARQQEGVLVSTQVSKEVKITQTSILDGAQAWKMFEETEKQNQIRNETDSLIWNKYNEGQPYDPVALRNSGQGNRYNFPTGFMSAIVDKVTPVPCKIIDQARYLTSASLKNYDYNTKAVDPAKAGKTEMLREKVTKTIRRWSEWKTFYQSLSQELVLIGRAFSLRLDPHTPWPKFFKTDQAFLPNGTGEHARSVQVMVAKQDYLVHELVNFIKDKQNATDAGWEIEPCVKAINEALPKQLNDDGSIATNQRSYEDAIREGNMGSSYSGATVIPVAHVWAIEANNVVGKENTVTQYTLYRKGNHEVLFKKENRFKRIEDLATLFTIEPGNGKFYGSRGLGRKLINKHLAIERMRNRLYDQLEMAGLIILKTDAARAPTVQFKVRHPFILTTTDANLEKEVIEANTASFKDADAMMRDWTQQAVGQYLPSAVMNDQGDREKTAREVSIDWQREAEAQVAFLSRFWGQFADLISCIQRALLDPETTDKAAQELQAELAEAGITREEMDEFANAPAAEVVQDLTQIQNQQIAMVAAKYANDPDINRRELKIRDITAMTSPAIAEALILPPQQVESNMIEAVRQQMMETEAMLTSTNNQGIPVSPRDAHQTHLEVLIPDLNQTLAAMTQMGGAKPDALGKVSMGLTHAQGHVQEWAKTGIDPKVVKPYEKALVDIENQLKKLAVQTAKVMAQAQDARETQAVNQQQGQLPPNLNPDQMIQLYKAAPEKIKRQIEQQLGFTPPTEEEMAKEHATEATLKHPDLPEKVAQASQANPLFSAPGAMPITSTQSAPPPTAPPEQLATPGGGPDSVPKVG